MPFSQTSLIKGIDQIEHTLHRVEKKWKRFQSSINRHTLQKEIN